MPLEAYSAASRRGLRFAAPTRDAISAVTWAVDGLAIIAAGFASRSIYQAATGIAVDQSAYLGAAVLLAAFFTILMRSWGGYDATNLLVLERQIRKAVFSWAVSFGLILGCAFMLKASADLSRGAAILYFFVGFTVVIAQRIAWFYGLPRALARGLVRRRNAIVLTAGSRQTTSAQVEALGHAGVDVVRTFELPAEPAGWGQTISWLISTTRRAAVDEILVVLPSGDLRQLEAIVNELEAVAIPVRLLPDLVLSRLALQPSRSVGPYAVIDLAREPLSSHELGFKRALDVAVAGVALLAVAPLIVVAMVAIKLDSPGPVLFRQNRRGFNGRAFKILKLRTMSVLENGPIVQATQDDPRVTRVGRWLRRTSVDELPQLWNVLRGEMSVVGPRPHAVKQDTFYDGRIGNYAFRHHVKPGLTGWAQVNGLRGETPEVSMMAARVDHDVWYINNWSFLLDLRILVLTAVRIVTRPAY